MVLRKRARVVERRIKAILLRRINTVFLETMTGDQLGVFEIPAKKDPDDYLRHYGYRYIGKDAQGEVWMKIVSLR